MAKNEAKIKFTAETGEFNSAIKKANSEMSELRAELRLNETQMKGAGASAELLENRHRILAQQLAAAESKSAALAQKVNKAAEIYGENSNEVSKLRTQLLNAQNAEEKVRQAVNNCNSGLKEQEGAAKSAEGGFTTLKGAVANLASDALQGAISKLSEFVSYLAQLPQETMEFRQDVSTLNTAFENVGFSADQAQEVFKNLYSVFGEDDRAVETANNIARMAKSQEELNQWTDIATGIWGTYQDALPVEGLAEAAGETAKTGQVTGVFADALNWSSDAAAMFADRMGGDVKTAEDAFNQALGECSSEQERQSLITETLTALYGDAADSYRDASGAQMEAKEAALEQQEAEAELATAIEPVTTLFSQLKTELLESVTPALQTLGEGFSNVLGWLKQHPTVLKAASAAIGVLAVGLSVAAVALGVYTVAQWAMNAALLANPITWIVLAVIAAIALLVAAGVAIYENWDKIKAKASEVWNGIKNTITTIVNAIKAKITTVFNAIKSVVSKVWSGIKYAITTPFNAAKALVFSIINSIKAKFNTLSVLKSAAANVFNGVKNAITHPIQTAKNAVQNAINKIKAIFNACKLKLDLKVPHIDIDGGKAPWGIGGKGRKPNFNVTWNAAGAIFTKPTLFGTPLGFQGVGEAGAEAVLPINLLENYINSAFERNLGAAASGCEVYNFYVNDATINDSAEMRNAAKTFLEEIVRVGGMNR